MTKALSLVLVLLMLGGNGYASVGPGPTSCLWPHCGTILPRASAEVREECTGQSNAPCFTKICGWDDGVGPGDTQGPPAGDDACDSDSALYWLFRNDANSGLGNRVLYVWPRADGSAYTEDIFCCYNAESGGTTSNNCTANSSGSTAIVGMTDIRMGTLVNASTPMVKITGATDGNDSPTILATDCHLANLDITGGSGEPVYHTGTGNFGANSINNSMLRGLVNDGPAMWVQGTGGGIPVEMYVTDTWLYAIDVGGDYSGTDTTLMKMDGHASDGWFIWQGGGISLDGQGQPGASSLQLTSGMTSGVTFVGVQFSCGGDSTCIEVDDDDVVIDISNPFFLIGPLGNGQPIAFTDDNLDTTPSSILSMDVFANIDARNWSLPPDLSLAGSSGFRGKMHWTGTMTSGAPYGFTTAGETFWCMPGWRFSNAAPPAGYSAEWECLDDGDGDGSPGFWAVMGGHGGVVNTTAGTLAMTAQQMIRTHHRAANATPASDVVYTLPAAAPGLEACFYDEEGDAGGIKIDPNDGVDQIILDGTAIGAGDAIDSPDVGAGNNAGARDVICLKAVDADTWVTYSRYGAWADESP